MLLYQYSNLFFAKTMMNSGKNKDLIVKNLNIFFKHENDFKKQMDSYNITDIMNVMEILFEAEVKIKTSSDCYLEYFLWKILSNDDNNLE
jgi:DNA polymerase III delta subunit